MTIGVKSSTNSRTASCPEKVEVTSREHAEQRRRGDQDIDSGPRSSSQVHAANRGAAAKVVREEVGCRRTDRARQREHRGQHWKEATISTLVQSDVQVKTGIFISDMPGAFEDQIVTIRLMPDNVVPTPATRIYMIIVDADAGLYRQA